MLNFAHATSRNCQGVTRRQLFQIGGLNLLGLSLAETLRRNAIQAADAKPKDSD